MTSFGISRVVVAAHHIVYYTLMMCDVWLSTLSLNGFRIRREQQIQNKNEQRQSVKWWWAGVLTRRNVTYKVTSVCLYSSRIYVISIISQSNSVPINTPSPSHSRIRFTCCVYPRERNFRSDDDMVFISSVQFSSVQRKTKNKKRTK